MVLTFYHQGEPGSSGIPGLPGRDGTRVSLGSRTFSAYGSTLGTFSRNWPCNKTEEFSSSRKGKHAAFLRKSDHFEMHWHF